MGTKLFVKRACVIAVIILCIFTLINTNQAAYAKVIKLNKGETYQLKIKKGTRVTVNKKNILKVTKKGKIKALKKGKCIVKVKTGKETLRFKVLVKSNTTSAATPGPEFTLIPVQTAAPGGYDIWEVYME